MGKKEGEDWSGLEERDIYPFLKAFVKTDYILATGVWKRLLQVFYPEKLSLSVNQNAISVVFHTPVTESVKADTEERGIPRQQWCLCVVHAETNIYL